MPSGELHIIAGTIGLLKLKGNMLSPLFCVNWYEIGSSIYTKGLVIDRDGRNFIGTFDAGIILSEEVNGKLTIRRLTFDTTAPAVHLEEFLSQL